MDQNAIGMTNGRTICMKAETLRGSKTIGGFLQTCRPLDAAAAISAASLTDPRSALAPLSLFHTRVPQRLLGMPLRSWSGRYET